MIYKDNFKMMEPKGDFVERFWKVTLPRYRRRKRIKVIFSSIAGIFLVFAMILFLKSSFFKQEVFVDDIWEDAYALIENEPNYYESEVVWITHEELELYNQLKNGNK